MNKKRNGFPGLTLLELVVVLAILGVLAAMLLPKFDGLQSAANHTATGSSMADLNRLIGIYKTAKTVYPDKWDSLMDNSGSALLTAGNAGSQVKGLHPQITGDAAVSKVTTATLSDAEVLGLQSAGITTLYKAPSGTISARAGDAFNIVSPVTSGMTVAVINTGSPNGKKIIDRFYRQNGVGAGVSGTVNGDNTKNKLEQLSLSRAPRRAAPDSGIKAAEPRRIKKIRRVRPTQMTLSAASVWVHEEQELVVFGVGPLNSLVPNSMMEAPTYGNANATYVYNRLLVVFQLTTGSTGTATATFKGTLASDGDLLDDLDINMQTGNL